MAIQDITTRAAITAADTWVDMASSMASGAVASGAVVSAKVAAAESVVVATAAADSVVGVATAAAGSVVVVATAAVGEDIRHGSIEMNFLVTMTMTLTPDSIEGTTIAVVRWVKLGVEVFGAGLVTLGVCVAIVQLIRNLAAHKPAEFTTTRLILARHLALALEFELGADILGTAIAPSWDQIGKLGAVAVIRTGLNFFLSMEMKAERTVEKSEAKLIAQAQPAGLTPCASPAETT